MEKPPSELRLTERTGSKTLEEPLQQYMNEAFAQEYLSWKREEELATAMAHGDENERIHARNEIILAHLRLVIAIVNDYGADPQTRQDLIQEGNMWLFRAADKFDLSYGVRFNKYASYWIRQGMKPELQRRRETIRIPDWVPGYANRIIAAMKELAEEGETVSWDAVADRMDLEDPRARKNIPSIMEGYRRALGKGELSEFMSDSVIQPSTDAIRHEEQERMERAIRMLDFRRRQIIRGVAGVGSEKKTDITLATELNLSHTRIYQLKKEAVRRLRLLLCTGEYDKRITDLHASNDATLASLRRLLAKDVWRMSGNVLERREGMQPSEERIAAYLGIDVPVRTEEPGQKHELRIDALYDKLLPHVERLQPGWQTVVRARFGLNGKPRQELVSDLSAQMGTTEQYVRQSRDRALHWLRKQVSPEEEERRVLSVRRKCAEALMQRAHAVLSEREKRAPEYDRLARYFGVDSMEYGAALDAIAQRVNASFERILNTNRAMHNGSQKARIMESRYCLNGTRRRHKIEELARDLGIDPTNVLQNQKEAEEKLAAAVSPEERERSADALHRALGEKVWRRGRALLEKETCGSVGDQELAGKFGIPHPPDMAALCCEIERRLPEIASEKDGLLLSHRYCLNGIEDVMDFDELAPLLGRKRSAMASNLDSLTRIIAERMLLPRRLEVFRKRSAAKERKKEAASACPAQASPASALSQPDTRKAKHEKGAHPTFSAAGMP